MASVYTTYGIVYLQKGTITFSFLGGILLINEPVNCWIVPFFISFVYGYLVSFAIPILTGFFNGISYSGTKGFILIFGRKSCDSLTVTTFTPIFSTVLC